MTVTKNMYLAALALAEVLADTLDDDYPNTINNVAYDIAEANCVSYDNMDYVCENYLEIIEARA